MTIFQSTFQRECCTKIVNVVINDYISKGQCSVMECIGFGNSWQNYYCDVIG